MGLSQEVIFSLVKFIQPDIQVPRQLGQLIFHSLFSATCFLYMLAEILELDLVEDRAA